MDSCILAAVDEDDRQLVADLAPDGGESPKNVNETEVTSLEEAKLVIAALRARQRAQAHQMLAWRRTLKLQVGFNHAQHLSDAMTIPSVSHDERSEQRGEAAMARRQGTQNDRSENSENHKTLGRAGADCYGQ